MSRVCTWKHVCYFGESVCCFDCERKDCRGRCTKNPEVCGYVEQAEAEKKDDDKVESAYSSGKTNVFDNQFGT